MFRPQPSSPISSFPLAKAGSSTETFTEMINAIGGGALPAKTIAEGIGISEQYLSDLKKGRRLPSVAVINSICTYMGRGPMGRKAWHLAGARAHGWEV